MAAPAQQHDAAFLACYGPWVLIAGASEGTGAAFAHQAAAMGANCILVARRRDKLAELEVALRETYGVDVACVSLDLSTPGAAAALEEAGAGKEVGLVIFNAGGDSVGGAFLASSYEAWRALTSRNIDMLTEACHRFATTFVKRGRGGILLVGSEAALGGTGRLAIYTATKGYALNFGESLWQELGPKGVDVLNLLIGATDTPKLRTVFARNGISPDVVSLTAADDVARIGLANLRHGPTVVLNEALDSESPLMSARVRRDRVEWQSKFLDNFYGPA
jgi:short-subunit dehydrogenase